MAENHAFFVRGDDGVEYGPVDLAELREWVTENRVGLGTSVRLDGSDGAWSAWQNYPELVALLAEVHVTGAVLPTALPVLAPFGRRVTACLFDLFLSFVLVVPLIVLLFVMLPPDVLSHVEMYSQAVMNGLMPPNPYPTWFLASFNAVCFGIPLLYFTGFVAVHGRTPAKSLMNLQVVDAQGRKPSPGKAFIRSFIFMVSVYYLFGIPLFYAFFNPQRRALHDLVAGTYVVES